MAAIISKMLMLFLLIAVGFAAYKLKAIDRAANKSLSRFVLNITLPCTVLDSVLEGETAASIGDAGIYFLLVALVYAIQFAIACPAPRLLRAPKKDGGVYIFSIVFANVAFMGYPVTEVIFGPGAAFYVSILNIMFNLLCYTVGILMLSGSSNGVNLKLLISPANTATVLAIIIYMTHIVFPSIITDTVSTLGRVTTPVSMILVGSILATLPIKAIFDEKRIWGICVLRLVAAPAAVWAILHVFVRDPFVLGILTVLAGMPTATMTSMLSLEYGANEKLASQIVFATTLLSVLTVPLIAYLIA